MFKRPFWSRSSSRYCVMHRIKKRTPETVLETTGSRRFAGAWRFERKSYLPVRPHRKSLYACLPHSLIFPPFPHETLPGEPGSTHHVVHPQSVLGRKPVLACSFLPPRTFSSKRGLFAGCSCPMRCWERRLRRRRGRRVHHRQGHELLHYLRRDKVAHVHPPRPFHVQEEHKATHRRENIERSKVVRQVLQRRK